MGATRLPVYSNEYGYHQINVWKETGAGAFRRTSRWLMPHLLINFDDLSESLGEVLAPAYDRREHDWESPTAYFHMGRPSSIYRFLRSHALNRRVMVLTGMARHWAYKFSINELRFKNNVSTPVKALVARSFLAEIDVFMDHGERRAAREAADPLAEATGADDEHHHHRRAYLQLLPLAEQGDEQAQFGIGHMHEHGRGVQQSHAEAATWYLRAARRGHLPAQVRLSRLYATGRGVPRDYVEAYFWTCLVATRDVRGTDRLLGNFASRMSTSELATARALVGEWEAAHA